MSELPEELLSRICFSLRALPKQEHIFDDGRSTLVNICLASKALHRVAHSHLYNTIHLRSWPSSEAARRSLIRSLLKPETARLVRHISAAHWQTPRSTIYHPRTLEQAPDQLAIAAADELALSRHLRDRIREGLEKGTEDAEVALILCLCPRLQSLASYCGLRVDESLVFAIIRETAAARVEVNPTVTLPLQHLRRVELAHWDTEGSTDLCEIRDTLGLPELEVFDGEMMSCEEFDREEGDAIHSSSVTRISLQNGHLDGPGLEWLLATCPKVKEFRMCWGPESYSSTILNYSSIGDALRQHGSSLTTLELDLGQIDPDELSDGEEGLLGDLSSLESLKVLKVPYSALFERHTSTISPTLRDVLPFGLRRLQIKNVDFGEDERDADESDASDGDESDGRDGSESDDRAAQFDRNLVDLMRDSRFQDLTRIKINRSEPFTGDAQAVGWDDSQSNRFWILLKRLSG